MEGVVGIWGTSGSSITSIVPTDDIDMIVEKESKPECIRRMNLLLIKLCIRIKEDHGWVF